MSLGIHRHRAGTPCGGTLHPYMAESRASLGTYPHHVVVDRAIPEQLGRCDRCGLVGIVVDTDLREAE